MSDTYTSNHHLSDEAGDTQHTAVGKACVCGLDSLAVHACLTSEQMPQRAEYRCHRELMMSLRIQRHLLLDAGQAFASLCPTADAVVSVDVGNLENFEGREVVDTYGSRSACAEVESSRQRGPIVVGHTG